jgi:hypothetical protein
MKAIIFIISALLILPGISNAQYTGGTGNSHSSFVVYGQPLPANLSSFTSDVDCQIVKLKWVTTLELNNNGFDIERKTIEGDFVKVAYVQGKGTVNTTTSYVFEDKNLQTGKYYYRLKQIDNNGNFKYYNLNNSVEILTPIKFILSQNFPNPFNPSTFISYQLPADSYVILKVYDIRGSEVATLINTKQVMGYYTVEFNANNFAGGIYFYRMIANSNGKDLIITKKMIMIK